MNKEKNIIKCKSVIFYSITDEEIFFNWLTKITCIKNIKFEHDTIYLILIEDLEYNDIKEIIAILYRYNIDMKQLQKLINNKNIDAFTPWKKEIFRKN